ncbi:hypothetical protein pb186bvf_007642 [Paramecium bursaria]
MRQNDAANISQIIEEVAFRLTQQKQKIQETHVEDHPNQNDSDQIMVSKQQLHLLVNEYFNEISNRYLSFHGKHLQAEEKNEWLKQLDEQIQNLDKLSQKVQSKTFTEKDQEQLNGILKGEKQQMLYKQIDEAVYNQTHASKQQREQQASVKRNNFILEGFYNILNNYASVQWSGHMPPQQNNIPVITAEQSQIKLLPFIDEQSFTLYDLDGKQTSYQCNVDSQPTVVLSNDGNIYLVGGVSNGYISGKVYCLNTSSGAVTKLPDMLVKRVGASALIVQQKFIYVIGGRTDNLIKTKLCERYNLNTQKWEYIPKLIQARSKAQTCLFDNYIYTFFGVDSQQQQEKLFKNINHVERFNLATEHWEYVQIENYLPGFDFSDGQCLQINTEQILLFGGLRYSQYFPNQIYPNRNVLAFNTTNNTISVLSFKLPVDFLSYTTPIIYNQEVYAIGHVLKSIDEKQSLFIDGAFIIKINKDAIKIIQYIQNKNK